MEKRWIPLLLVVIAVLTLSGLANATLYDMGGGMIYDSDLNMTWLQDANYAQTSGYDADGLMTFDEANTWAASLTVGGTGGWRLPTLDPSNPRPAAATSANEIGSLLMTLTNGGFDLYFPPYAAADISPFYNLPSADPLNYSEAVYWTGLAGDPGFAWEYYMSCG